MTVLTVSWGQQLTPEILPEIPASQRETLLPVSMRQITRNWSPLFLFGDWPTETAHQNAGPRHHPAGEQGLVNALVVHIPDISNRYFFIPFQVMFSTNPQTQQGPLPIRPGVQQAETDPMKLVHHSVDDLCDLIHKGHDASLQDLRGVLLGHGWL